MITFAQTMYARVPAAKAAVAFIEARLLPLNIALLAAAVALCAAYIVQVNAAVSSGYAMRDAERRVDQLVEDHRRTELAVSKAQTLDHVRRTARMMGLVPAGQPVYVTMEEPTVALAR